MSTQNTLGQVIMAIRYFILYSNHFSSRKPMQKLFKSKCWFFKRMLTKSDLFMLVILAIQQYNDTSGDIKSKGWSKMIENLSILHTKPKPLWLVTCRIKWLKSTTDLILIFQVVNSRALTCAYYKTFSFALF